MTEKYSMPDIWGWKYGVIFEKKSFSKLQWGFFSNIIIS